nr:hypothetical protein GCM10020063_041600 [Dactylosporangium thailandense]
MVVVAWNAAASATFGWAKPETCGRSLVDLLAPLRLAGEYRAGLDRIAAGRAGRCWAGGYG